MYTEEGEGGKEGELKGEREQGREIEIGREREEKTRRSSTLTKE